MEAEDHKLVDDVVEEHTVGVEGAESAAGLATPGDSPRRRPES